MTETTHLTNDLQFELSKIGSTVRLQTENKSVIKMNYKDWAWAIVNSRSIEVSTFVGLDDKHLQLEESGIIACNSSTNDILEIATIIDKWLGKQLDIFQLADQHNSIKINKTYQDLKTLTVDEILQHRWTYFSEEITKGRISFRQDVFEEFRKHFSYLYPIFSHDNLLFSNVIEQINDDFKSPVVFCDKDIIWTGFFADNSKEEGKKAFKTKDIEQAVEMTKKLLPKDKHSTINPYTN
ncbi:hypothetical protein [Flectobacillus roseus]|uniref:hypothetical protein n=1 Tax=Flectobacillus roseus TaxID=502259 RepID=UPI0024B81856|nr:hypothetical protein [Flectobacillus roseus]MDI9868928.1 hypothetical protein [Flectobacillus roseus]